MAIGFRGETHDIASTTGTVTVAEPSGTAQNDVLVYLSVFQAGAVVTPPSGWTTFYSGTGPNPDYDYALAYVLRGASAPNRGWAITGTPYHELFLLSFSGCDTSTPIDTYAQTPVARAASANPDPPSATAARSTDMAIAVGINWAGSSAGGWTAPTGYTVVTDNTAANDGVMSIKQLSSSGAENPSAYANVNVGGGAADYWAATVLLMPGPTAPSVSTFAATGITPATATGNGSVDDDGGATITTRGVCWGTSPQPTTSNSTATTSGTTGAYSVSMTGLTNNTTYHMRAYAINSVGTSYGPNLTFISNGAALIWIKQ